MKVTVLTGSSLHEWALPLSIRWWGGTKALIIEVLCFWLLLDFGMQYED